MVRHPSSPLKAAAVIAALLAWVYVAMQTTLGRWVDGATLEGFIGLRTGHTVGTASAIAQLCNPRPYAFFLLCLIAIALIRGRKRTALAVAVALPLASLTTALLKPLLSIHREQPFLANGQIPDGSWPSGHTTAAMSLALGLVLVVGPRLRPLAAAAGGLFAFAVPFCVLMLGWHYPSDVVGGYGIAAFWVSLAVAALWATEPERRGELSARLRGRLDSRRQVAPTAVVAAVTLAAAGLLALVKAERAVQYADAHTVFVAGVLFLGAVALALAAAFALLLSAPKRR